jgi:hypothetical protein
LKEAVDFVLRQCRSDIGADAYLHVVGAPPNPIGEAFNLVSPVRAKVTVHGNEFLRMERHPREPIVEGLATTILAPQSRAFLTVEMRVSPDVTKMGIVRHGLIESRLIDRMNSNPPSGGSLGSQISMSIFCSLRTVMDSRTLRTSITRLQPNPRKMLCAMLQEYGLGSATKKESSARLI